MSDNVAVRASNLTYEDRKNAKQRREEKTLKFIDWLLTFHHSTVEIVLCSMGVKKSGQRPFIKSLENKGFLNYIEVPYSKRKLVMLSVEGKNYGATFSEKALSYTTEPSRISYNQLHHHLSVQRVVGGLLGRGEIVDYLSTRTLDYSIKGGKKIDALVIKEDGSRIAIEFERSIKDQKRIIRGFLDGIIDFRDKNYSSVIYYFASQAMKEHYETIFSAKEWEVYKRNSYGKLAKTIDVFKPDEYRNLRESFSFVYNSNEID